MKVPKFYDGAERVPMASSGSKVAPNFGDEPESDGLFGKPKYHTDDDGNSTIKPGHLVQYQRIGPGYAPCPGTQQKLPAGLYRISSAGDIMFFEPQDFVTDRILRLPDSKSDFVIAEIERFWTLKQRFLDLGYTHKRGFLLHGPPGSGKTSTVAVVVKAIIEEGGIAIVGDNHPEVTSTMLARLRQVEPERPVMVILEDIDSLIKRFSEAGLLATLDGEKSINNVVYIACHDPSARILTADLRWVPAGNIKAGDELWGLDEGRGPRTTSTGRETTRRFRRSKVVSSFLARKECVRVHLNTGESFVCTTDHPWLSSGAAKRSGRNCEWTVASDLLNRPNLVRPFLPWTQDTSWEAAWLSGFLDGEGYIRRGRDRRTSGVGVGQAIGPTADKMVRLAANFGKFIAESHDPGRGYKMQTHLRSVGGVSEAASFLGRVRPDRLIKNFSLEGGMVQSIYPAEVVEIEPIGMHDVQSIQTTTHTYFAEGFAVHNTTNYPEDLDKRVTNRPSRFDRVVYIGMPSLEARRLYLESRKVIPEADLDRWADKTEGLSIAHLKELLVGVYIFGGDLEDEIKRLKDMDKTPNSESAPGRKGKAGFGLVME